MIWENKLIIEAEKERKQSHQLRTSRDTWKGSPFRAKHGRRSESFRHWPVGIYRETSQFLWLRQLVILYTCRWWAVRVDVQELPKCDRRCQLCRHRSKRWLKTNNKHDMSLGFTPRCACETTEKIKNIAGVQKTMDFIVILQPNSNGLQPTSDGLQPTGEWMTSVLCNFWSTFHKNFTHDSWQLEIASF